MKKFFLISALFLAGMTIASAQVPKNDTLRTNQKRVQQDKQSNQTLRKDGNDDINRKDQYQQNRKMDKNNRDQQNRDINRTGDRQNNSTDHNRVQQNTNTNQGGTNQRGQSVDHSQSARTDMNVHSTRKRDRRIKKNKAVPKPHEKLEKDNRN